MRYSDLVKKLQKEMNAQGAKLAEDGIPGPRTQKALLEFDVALVVSKIPESQPVKPAPVTLPGGETHLAVIDWLRGELGQKEIKGSKDNPRIRWYHTHSANIGSKEHPDEVPWCSSVLNAGADECGMEKTDNALASSWRTYNVDTGDIVEEGDIVVLKFAAGNQHVTLANKTFSRSKDSTFEGLGGNQADSVKVSVYKTSDIVAARKWKPKAGTVTAPITTGSDPDEGTEPWYRRMFEACKVNPGKEAQLERTLATIERGMPRYREVAERLGAENVENFAWILGAIHFKEASCDFDGVLHNGEKIVGTGKKTSIVPKGRGPFSSWEDSAVDAIAIESSRWRKLVAGGADIGDILWALERFNGTGYITGAGRAETSPYLWACSNINDGRGKYVSDGKFDPTATTGATAGAALILKELARLGKFVVA